MTVDELTHEIADAVPHEARAIGREPGGIRQVPIQSLARRDDGTIVPAAHRDNIVPWPSRHLRDAFRAMPREAQPRFGQQFNRQRMHLARGMGSGAGHFPPRPGQLAGEGFGHLGAERIGPADEQHARHRVTHHKS